jgi:hypothetical protein
MPNEIENFKQAMKSLHVILRKERTAQARFKKLEKIWSRAGECEEAADKLLAIALEADQAWLKVMRAFDQLTSKEQRKFQKRYSKAEESAAEGRR